MIELYLKDAFIMAAIMHAELAKGISMDKILRKQYLKTRDTDSIYKTYGIGVFVYIAITLETRRIIRYNKTVLL